MASQWHETPAGQRRLVQEIDAVRGRYGNAAVLRKNASGCFEWHYTIHKHGRAFAIRVEYPSGFPIQAPNVYSVEALPNGLPHRYNSYRLCWHGHSGSDWNPTKNTAVNVIIRMHQWYDNLLVWLTKGIWPADRVED